MQKETPIENVPPNPFSLQKFYSWQKILSSLNNEEKNDDKEKYIKINDQIYTILIKKLPQNQKTSEYTPRIFNDPLEKTPRDSYQNDIVRQISSDLSKKSSNKSGSDSKDLFLNLKHNESCNNGFESNISEFQEGFKDEISMDNKNLNRKFVVNDLPKAFENVEFKVKDDESDEKELYNITNSFPQSANEKNLEDLKFEVNTVNTKPNKKKSNSMHIQEFEQRRYIEKEPSTAKLKVKESVESSGSELKINEQKNTLRKNSNSLKFLCSNPSSDSLKLMELKPNPLNLNKSNTISFAPVSSVAETMKEQKIIEAKRLSLDTFNSAEDLAFSIADSREESPKKMLSIGPKKTSIEQNQLNKSEIFSKNNKNDEDLENNNDENESNDESNEDIRKLELKFQNNLQLSQNLKENEKFFQNINRNSNGFKNNEKSDERNDNPFNLRRETNEKSFNNSGVFFESERNLINEQKMKEINFQFKNNKSDSMKSGRSPKRYECNLEYNLDDLDEDKSELLNSDIENEVENLSISEEIYSILKNSSNPEGSPSFEKIKGSMKKLLKELKRRERDLLIREKELEEREVRLKKLFEYRNTNALVDEDDEFDFFKKKPQNVIPDDSQIRRERDLLIREKELEEREVRLKNLFDYRNNNVLDDEDDEFDFFKKKPQYVIPDDSEIHFLFLYSSPLITFFKDQDGNLKKRPIFNEINYVRELANIKKIFSSNSNLKFLSLPARLENFSLKLDKNPIAIHFCGHGVLNNEETFGLSFDEKDGNFLVFEQKNGVADFVSAKTLSQLLKKMKNPLYFVFVASCHSKIVGEVFRDAGALHVICVKNEEKIMDEACVVFTRAFYNSCLIGKNTICEAFEIAKNQVKAGNFPKGEENKFVMLINQENYYEEHQCTGWIDFGPCQFQDLTPKCEYSNLPSKIDYFCGRNENMQELISLILENRIVTIKGIAGIGKSSLLKETIHFIYDRLLFADGIIYLNLIACETKEALLSCLSTCVLGHIQDLITKTDINPTNKFQDLIESLRNKEILIALDNIDNILFDKYKFLIFFQQFLNNCSNIKFVITSRTSLGLKGSDFIEKIMHLGPLKEEDGLDLFIKRAPRKIEKSEFEALLSSCNKGKKLSMKDLSKHCLFEYFGGHPQAISLAASLLEEKSLKDTFFHLQNSHFLKEFDSSSELNEQDRKLFNSLKLSLDVSWESLHKNHKDSSQILACIGLLPSGISEDEMKFFWPKNWEKCCEILMKNSFLRKSQKEDKVHYSLFPFMTKSVEEHLNIDEKKKFNQKILEYYSKKISDIQEHVFTISSKANQKLNYFVKYELNIRACIFREISFNGNNFHEKSLYNSFDVWNNFSVVRESEIINDCTLKTDSPFKENSSFNSSSIKLPTENLANQLTTPTAALSASANFGEMSIIISEEGKSSKNDKNKLTYSIDGYIKKEANDAKKKDTPKFKPVEKNFNSLEIKNDKQIDKFPMLTIDIPENCMKIQFMDSSDDKLMKSTKDCIYFKKDSNQSGMLTGLNENSKSQESIIKNDLLKARKKNSIKIENIFKLIIDYLTILTLMKRYKECQKMINSALALAKDSIVIANIYRISATILFLMGKDKSKMKKEYLHAKDLFRKDGCILGEAICEAAIGYSEFLDNEFTAAILNLKSALIKYESMNHYFGVFFIKKCLAVIYCRKNQFAEHFKYDRYCREFIKKQNNLRDYYKITHNEGMFILRGKGNFYSLFLENSFQKNAKPPRKLREKNIHNSNIERNDSLSSFAKQLGARMDESQELEGSIEDSVINSIKMEDPPKQALTPKANINDYERKPPLKSFATTKLN